MKIKKIQQMVLATIVIAVSSCTAKPPQQILSGEDRNLFSKQELSNPQLHDLDKSLGHIGVLVEPLKKLDAKKMRFEITKSYLTLFKIEDNTPDEAVIQFEIKGHFDLVPEKSKDGKETQYLVKDDKAKTSWEERGFIEVDPSDAKKIAPMRDTLINLFEVAKIKRRYQLLRESIPGLGDKETAAIMAQFKLKEGEQIELKFTKTEMLLFARSASGQPVVVAKIPVQYFDLIRDQDSDGEDTATIVKDQKAQVWSSRRYVEINPDNTSLEDGENKLLVKDDIDGKCFAPDKLIPEIRKSISAELASIKEGEQICLDVDQSILTVSSLKNGKKKMLLTLDIDEHLDINFDDTALVEVLPEGKYARTWDKRRYVKLSLKNPHRVENYVRPNILERSALKGEFIYVATVVSAHSENGLMFAGQTLVGNNRIRFEQSEDSVTAYKIGETLNQSGSASPSLRYGAEYFDVGRARNQFGDGTHLVAELTDHPWEQRKQVRINFGRNEISAYLNDFFNMEALYGNNLSLRQSRLIGEPEVEGDYISFQTEDVIVRDPNDGSQPGESDLETMSVVIRHSFMRVDQRSYVAKEYTDADYARFGYFDTTEFGLDPDGNPTDATLRKFIGRHDISGDKKIVIYLSDNYPDRYVEVTQQVVAAWNTAMLAATGRSDVIELRHNSGQQLGDPRYNMIAFADERNISAPAGYGPSIADPVTGEMISSRTFLYGDSIKYIRSAGADYYDIIKEGKLPSDFENEGIDHLVNPQPGGIGRSVASQKIPKTGKAWAQASRNATGPTVNIAHMLAKADQSTSSVISSALNASAMKDLRGAIEFNDTMRRYNAMKVRMAARGHCMTGTQEHIVSAIQYIRAHIDMTKAELMNDLEMKSVFNILLHEVGHNLGLRHNFHGSFDEMNFHPKYFKLKALEATGIKTPGEYAANYRTTSVMDYNDMFEGLAMAPGPYDIAAIKYGYGDIVEVIKRDAAGEVERDDSGRVIAEDLRKDHVLAGMEIRPYKFCTDGHLADDPTCNQFDRGTTVNEIVTSLADQYDVGYFLKGFRRGRRDFRDASNSVFMNTILPMRQILDETFYKLIAGDFEGQTPSDDIKPGNFADYVDALNKTFNFYVKVLSAVEPGTYHRDATTGRYVLGAAAGSEANLTVPLGLGKYLEPAFVDGEFQEKLTRRGVEFDKLATIFILTMRGYPARKYERISLAANYSALAKEGVLDILSRYMRDDFVSDVFAVKNAEKNTLVAVPAGYKPKEGEELVSLEVPASTNIALKTNAAIFTMMNYNSSADQTFGDYIDFRIKGFNDQGLSSTTDKVEFLAANGLKSYVVPQTIDGLSISYAVAKPAADLSKAMIASLAQLALVRQDVETAVSSGFDPVLASVLKIYKSAFGEDLDPETVNNLKKKHDKDTLKTLIEFVDSIETQATEAGMTELLAEIQAERHSWPSVMTDIIKKIDSEQGLSDEVDTSKQGLVSIESDLLQLKNIYTIFN